MRTRTTEQYWIKPSSRHTQIKTNKLLNKAPQFDQVLFTFKQYWAGVHNAQGLNGHKMNSRKKIWLLKRPRQCFAYNGIECVCLCVCGLRNIANVENSFEWLQMQLIYVKNSALFFRLYIVRHRLRTHFSSGNRIRKLFNVDENTIFWVQTYIFHRMRKIIMKTQKQ